MTGDSSQSPTEASTQNAPELLVSAWTSAGTALPLSSDERSPLTFLDRVRAASNAGFTGFGLLHADLVLAVEQYGLPDMRTILSDHGMEHLELEMLGDWFATGEARAGSDAVRKDLLKAAEVLQPRQIKAGADYAGRTWPFDEMVEEFVCLCGEAEDAGTRIALEPMPFANVPDIASGRSLIETADHRAGGLLIDIWHVCRAGTPYSEVADVAKSMLFAVELDDADSDVVGTLLEDTLHERRLCGEGSFDVPGFVSAVCSTGYDGPWGVEIISREHRSRSLVEQVEGAYNTTISFLA